MLNKKIIVVLGMHRSGTSAFTRSLEVLGVELGDKLMQPIANVNNKGFFEDLDINQFNDYLLNKMNCIWCSCLIPQKNQLELLNNQADIDTALQLLNNKLQNINLFGFKDPRVSVLLPFWQKIFSLCNLDVSYLIAIRNPLSVALSLKKRDHFTIKKGLFLWFEYMLASLQQTQNLNRVLVHYEDLMSKPVDAINAISKAFNLSINNKELNNYINDFLDPDLQHNNLTLEDLKNNNCYYNSIYQLYLYFLNLKHSNSDIVSSFNLNSIADLFNVEINPFTTEFNFQNDLIIQKNEILNSLITETNNFKNHRTFLLTQLDQQNKIISDQNKIITDQSKNREDAKKVIHDLHERIKSNATHITLLEANLRNMETSLSWKLTQPLRSLMKLIR